VPDTSILKQLRTGPLFRRAAIPKSNHNPNPNPSHMTAVKMDFLRLTELSAIAK